LFERRAEMLHQDEIVRRDQARSLASAVEIGRRRGPASQERRRLREIDAEILGLGPLGEGQAVAAERRDVAEDGPANQVAERFERRAFDHFGPGWEHKLQRRRIDDVDACPPAAILLVDRGQDAGNGEAVEVDAWLTVGAARPVIDADAHAVGLNRDQGVGEPVRLGKRRALEADRRRTIARLRSRWPPGISLVILEWETDLGAEAMIAAINR
jgi:hypothetical protein